MHLDYDNREVSIDLSRGDVEFLQAYFEAVYFTETGDTDQPSSDAVLCGDWEAEQAIDCLSFLAKARPLIDASDASYEQAGHDFWLTRNHHGTGFWDRPEIYNKYSAKTLTDWSKQFGETWVEWEND